MYTITRGLLETLRQHFILQKLAISYAIFKPFPFFEGLRDKSFISERMYMESMEACRNMVPVSRVAYNILTKLEEPFNVTFLEMLFSPINLREYPDLRAVHRSFMNVITACQGWSRATVNLFEVPANPAERSLPQNRLPLPAPQSLPRRCSTAVPSVSQPRATPQYSATVLHKPPSPASPAKSPPRVVQKGRTTPANFTAHINDEEDALQEPDTPPAAAQVIRNDSPEPKEPEEPQEAASPAPVRKGKKRKISAWSTEKKRQKKKRLSRGTTSFGNIVQKKRQMAYQATQDNSSRNLVLVTGTQKARTKCAQMSKHEGTTSSGNRSQTKLQAAQKKDNLTYSGVMTRAQAPRAECAQTSGPEEKKRGKKVSSNSTRSCQKNVPPKGKPKDETVDFQSPELPVTCGSEKGTLFTEKMKKGSWEKCIQNEKGAWFTPRQFEVKGKGSRSKDWKRNVRCGGNSLQQLMEKGLLFCPPRISLKREWESSDGCEVCCRGGQLLCCDTCPRAFHQDCHIPLTEAERSPWSCTFCRMKASSRSQQCLRESEVLARQMGPEEQLKCEFLLLKAYCHPQSAFFAKTPRNIRDYAEPFREAMWLDLVKERLAEKVYTVAWFVRDMRLIFRNHKTFYKASDFGQAGLDLEAKFEKGVKEVLIFHEATGDSFQAPP
ncbi:PREDICTED: sp110 nuclear body protein [Miniopterus natalensis]|uniref:sp110 nuclear body protein n=1 Tax=Miniopterus natalensis TaxID=291302 RepID=UPI0007A70683|nr:PREDICTED: sp110 nuclear body protein [Miniopterus natalensis]